MRDYSVVLQAAYDPLNVHSDVGYAPRVGGVFFGQGKATSGERWQDELDFTFKQKILDNNSSSAFTSSPGQRYSRNPELAAINLSLHLPPYAGEMNIIKPHGAIAMRNLIVLCP